MAIELLGPVPVIQTRKGNSIPLEKGHVVSLQEVVGQDAYVNATYNDKLRLSPMSPRKPVCGQYNCHGLTFLNRRAMLLQTTAVELVLSDDEYYKVEEAEAKPGDIAIYSSVSQLHARSEIEHSGVVTWVEQTPSLAGWNKPVIWVLSKWGHGAEYIHHSDYGPYHHCTVAYMREGINDKPTDIRSN